MRFSLAAEVTSDRLTDRASSGGDPQAENASVDLASTLRSMRGARSAALEPGTLCAYMPLRAVQSRYVLEARATAVLYSIVFLTRAESSRAEFS